MVMMVKVNPPLMRRPNKSWHRTSVNLLQNKTKKIFNEIVTPITAIIGFSDEKYFERKQVRLYWDSTPVTRHWKVFSSNLETEALHQSVGRTKTSVLDLSGQQERSEVSNVSTNTAGFLFPELKFHFWFSAHEWVTTCQRMSFHSSHQLFNNQ